jgi:hypothetical protein
MSKTDPCRSRRLNITWTHDELIGRVAIGDELWAAVEWSEKRQA